MIVRVCPQCGNEFQAKKSVQVFCGKRCNMFYRHYGKKPEIKYQPGDDRDGRPRVEVSDPLLARLREVHR